MARIAIDARMLGPATTGIGLYIEELLTHLLPLDTANEYLLILSPEASFSPPHSNVSIARANAHWYGWKEQIVLPWQIKKYKPHLIHYPHFNVPLLSPTPFVVTIHDLTPKYYPGHKMGSAVRRYGFERVFAHALTASRAVIAVSKHTRDEILTYYPAIAKEKIHVIYEGSGRDSAPPRGPFVWETYQRQKQIATPYIFYTGVWRNHKNLVGLLRAFAVLKSKYKLPHTLVLGGEEDPHYPEVRRTWEELGMRESVRATGFLTPHELTMLYAHADCFVLPSFSEGFGFVGLEAMRVGVPVAASDIPALREIYAEAAVYFDPHHPTSIAHTMHTVLTNVQLRERLVRVGMERWKIFAWEDTARKTLALYQQALA